MKTKIVIASVLKPVDDVRAYSKLSQSMTKTNKYEVNIIGNSGKKLLNENNIKLHEHSLKRNNWPRRFLIRLIILFKVFSIRPKLLIISTHELLFMALVAKAIVGCKLVYDVQENYYLNIKQINQSIFRGFFASIIRLKERTVSPFINQFWLAESCYQEELPFVRKKFVILENKAFDFDETVRSYAPIKMIYSGTVSSYGGIELAVNSFMKIKKIYGDSTLKVVGQVHNKDVKNWLSELEKTTEGLTLNISTDPIPHEQILESISQANLGIISYQPSLVNHKKVPTKLYEYSRYRLPYLVQENTKWSQIGEKLGGAISIDFNKIEPIRILDFIENSDSLFKKVYPEEATWEYESKRLISSLESLINLH